jgi:2-isopropylmalate synthase
MFDHEYQINAPGVAHCHISESTEGVVTVRADVRWADGTVQALSGTGSGPIDAFVGALQAHVGVPIRVLDYHEHAITSGAGARAVAYIELRIGEQTLFGVAIDHNIVNASFNAVVSALRRASARTVAMGPAAVHA